MTSRQKLGIALLASPIIGLLIVGAVLDPAVGLPLLVIFASGVLINIGCYLLLVEKS